MTKPSSHHVTVNNLRIHYTESGSGPPILLIHGFPTSRPEAAALLARIYDLSDKPLDVTRAGQGGGCYRLK